MKRLLSIMVAGALVVPVMSACGPEGQSIDDSCPDVPLFHYVYDAGTWTRVYPGDGSVPLSAADEAKIAKAETDNISNGGRCLTPAGSATSLSPSRDAGAK